MVDRFVILPGAASSIKDYDFVLLVGSTIVFLGCLSTGVEPVKKFYLDTVLDLIV